MDLWFPNVEKNFSQSMFELARHYPMKEKTFALWLCHKMGSGRKVLRTFDTPQTTADSVGDSSTLAQLYVLFCLVWAIIYYSWGVALERLARATEILLGFYYPCRALLQLGR